MAKARKSQKPTDGDSTEATDAANVTDAPAPTTKSEMCVYVVDDDEAMRDSLAFLFESVGRKVLTFSSADVFMRELHDQMHGCIVLDVRMPGMSGLELQAELTNRQVPLPVILLTAHADVPMAVRSMRMGAYDFIEKPCNDQVLLDRVNQAIAYDREHHSEHEIDRETADRLGLLSPRERQVMKHVVAGMLNKQIAAELGISIKTVEVHRARVMEKMKAPGLAELVRMAIASGI